MATFIDHCNRAKSNHALFIKLNSENVFLDWQVTACFYCALHLISAHLLKAGSLRCKNHSAIEKHINFQNSNSSYRLSEDDFVSYANLYMLSKRARYMSCEKDGVALDDVTYHISDKHIARAVRDLNRIIVCFENIYSQNLINPSKINCSRIKLEKLQYFTHSV